MDSLFARLRCIVAPEQYKKEQWFALVLGLLCLCIGVWAGYQGTPSSRSQALSFYSLEAALAFSVIALLAFAFSSYPKSLNET